MPLLRPHMPTEIGPKIVTLAWPPYNTGFEAEKPVPARTSRLTRRPDFVTSFSVRVLFWDVSVLTSWVFLSFVVSSMVVVVVVFVPSGLTVSVVVVSLCLF